MVKIMAKKDKLSQPSFQQEKAMTLEEAKAFRASLYKPQPRILNDAQKREAFRIWWTGYKKQFGYANKGKTMEKALWLHLKAVGMDSPEKFEKGITSFGLK